MLADIVIHPFGEIQRDLVEAVRAAVEQVFKVRVTLGEKLSVPARSYSRERGQYLSTRLLDVLATHAHKCAKLGITTVDLFVPELNFVFGEASTALRVAVFSIARLNPRAYGEPEDELMLMNRAITEAVHELGHVFGLAHCTLPNCVMWFSNRLSETDRKGSDFCPRCATRLAQRV
jgi:archaemetzincin